MYQNQEYKNRFRILKGGLISLVVASNLYAAPSGGVVTSGNATINQNGNITNINQSSQKASINWKDFSISKNETVNFNQLNQNSITLNRVVGTEKSVIDGALNSNGQVWILNSNGTLFGKNAKVNTSGLLVTTKELSDKDFQNGNYNFKGDSKNSIENLGNIDSSKYIAFVANAVINNGTIKVYSGTINLTGASEFSISLDENSNISLKVTKGVLDALVENNNLLIANGGNVYLTTNAKNELLKGVVNNTGIIEAASLDDLQSEVILFANGGTANISGEIKAKNSFVETSGKDLNVTNEAKITAKKWLLDPVNVTIDNSNGTIGNEKVGATVIQTALNNNTDIEIQANNNINVNQAIAWSTAQELTLNAGNNIYINKEITATNNSGKLALKYGQSSATGGSGDYYVNAKVNLKAGQNFSTQKGSNVANLKNYMVITDLGNVGSTTGANLQGINGNLSGNYVLGRDIDASATSSWNSGAGFNPLGNYTTKFTGIFNGLGHTISDLFINHSSTDYVGLFGYTSNATIKNVGLVNVDIAGNDYVGGLVGGNDGTITNSYVSGTVSGSGSNIGGLVGGNYGIIENSYATGTVSGNRYVGGLVGGNYGTITNSYVSGTVSGSGSNIGGLLGVSYGIIENSYYDNEANTGTLYDSTIGRTKAQIVNLFSNFTGWETTRASIEGYGVFLLPYLLGVTREEDKVQTTLFQGGYGTQINPYTITNWTQLQNINNSNILTSGYYFNLLNNLSSSTSDYTNLASSSANSSTGWTPIGNATKEFRGTFDGQGNTISNLYINRNTYGVGLFGASDNVSTIRNIGLKDVNIRGASYVGALVGQNYGTITNSYASGAVNGYFNNIGGLVGQNNGTITNSYASVSVLGTSAFGGLVGDNGMIIQNSFYDKTKFSGNGIGIGLQTRVTGLTTEEMSYGGIFKNAGWDIVADSSVISLTPILKYDSVNNKYVWAIAPKTFTANLGNQSTDYNGLLQNLSSIYTSQAIFGTAGVNFKFVDVDNNDITAYKNAGTYSNIGVVSLDEFIVAGVGTKGTLTINKANVTVTANSMNKVYNGQTQNLSGYSVIGLVGNDRISSLTGITGDSVSGKNVGTYNTNLSGTDTNYNLIFVNGKLTINKANLTVSADNKSKIEGEINPSLTYVANGLIGNDTLNGSLSTTATITSQAGNYDIEKGTLDNSNYNIDFIKGTLSVEAKPISTPEPQPIIDKNIEKVVASVDRIVNTNLPKNHEFMPNSNNQINSSTQTTPDISNPNVKVISFNEGRNVQVIGDGVKMPVNNVQDNIKQLFVQNEEIK